MAESSGTPEGATQEASPQRGANAASPKRDTQTKLRRAILGVGAVGLVFLGYLNWQQRPDPPPVIKEVPAFALTHHDGSTITQEQFLGAPWIADFIFTRCPAICPRMTAQMRQIEETLGDSSPVRIASFTVDPEHDTPAVLAEYAAKYGADQHPAGWYFLTGETETLYNLSQEGFMLGVQAAPPEDVAAGNDPILHSNRFVLVDRQNRIRGYYDPFDPTEVERLLRELRAVQRER